MAACTRYASGSVRDDKEQLDLGPLDILIHIGCIVLQCMAISRGHKSLSSRDEHEFA